MGRNLNCTLCPAGAARAADASSIYDFSAPQYGTQRSLADFKGKVVVVMNIASE